MNGKPSTASAPPLPRAGRHAAGALRQGAVPLFFSALCVAGVIAAGLDLNFLINEIITRLGRNSFLVLSLLVPVVAGLGLNFGIVIGAMAGQTALIIVTHYRIEGWVALGLPPFSRCLSPYSSAG